MEPTLSLLVLSERMNDTLPQPVEEPLAQLPVGLLIICPGTAGFGLWHIKCVDTKAQPNCGYCEMSNKKAAGAAAAAAGGAAAPEKC